MPSCHRLPTMVDISSGISVADRQCTVDLECMPHQLLLRGQPNSHHCHLSLILRDPMYCTARSDNLGFICDFFYAQQQNASHIIALVWACLSVFPSVCFSVTLLYFIKTMQARITKSLLWTPCIKDSSFFVTKSCDSRWGGSPHMRVWKRGTPSKKSIFLPPFARLAWKTVTDICTDKLLIITSTNDELFSGINIDNLERPWTFKIMGFSEFFMISGGVAHFKSELHQNVWR